MIAATIAVAGVMVALWALATAIRDVSIVDIAWGLLFGIAAWTAHLAAGDDATGAVGALLLVLVTAWGLRLATHIARRNLGTGEDPRYAAMRKKFGDTFWVRSLFTVFLLQGALALIIGWPVIEGASRDSGDIGALAILGTAVWAIGVFFEAVGDWQLDRFKADPASKGKVMDRGLWRYTRHPNYFGDSCLWFGMWLVALDAGVTPLTIVSPVVMTFFLLKVSGVALLEKSIGSRREGYDEYVKRTSAFFPLPPKRRA
jgi:steroid 5-alpha reductase family enzyme